MIEIKEVVCPVDFSEFSRRALHHAVTIAKWYGSHVSVLYVYGVGLPPAAFAPGPAAEALPPAVLTPQTSAQLLAELKGFAEREQRQGIPMDFLVTDGNIAREILIQARALHADLLVIGTHGRSGFEHLVLGSIAEKVLRTAECPVLTVPREAPDAVQAVPRLFHEILLAVDFSDASTRALEYALSLAQEADAHLTLLHVIELPQSGEGFMPAGFDLASYLRDLSTSFRDRLRSAVPESTRVYCHVEERVEVGAPYREILRVAAEQRVGVIIMGAHGHNVLDRMFFGSTAQHVVRQAHCPVLTLRGD